MTGLRYSNSGWSASADSLPLLATAALWVDPINSVPGEQVAVNQGTAGAALNAQYGSTPGVDTNDPTFLPWTDTDYLFLPGTAGNELACTAPAGTASYSATPLGGGAPTTGAAVPGAFTFATAGSWERIELLTAGSAVVAEWIGSSSSQTGMTDGFGVVWTFNTGAANLRRLAMVTRPCWSCAIDDYLQVGPSSLLDVGVADSLSVVLVHRTRGLQVLFGGYWGQNAAPGRYDAFANFSDRSIRFRVGDGTVNPETPAGVQTTSNALSVFTAVRDTAADTLQTYVNNTAGSTVTDTTTGVIVNSGVLQMCRTPGGSVNMEVFGWALFRRALTAADVATIVATYGASF